MESAAVWVAGGYRFRFAEPIISHLAHVALGISLVMGAIFVIVILFMPFGIVPGVRQLWARWQRLSLPKKIEIKEPEKPGYAP